MADWWCSRAQDRCGIATRSSPLRPVTSCPRSTALGTMLARAVCCHIRDRAQYDDRQGAWPRCLLSADERNTATQEDWIADGGNRQTRSFGDVGSMSGLLESRHGWAIVHAPALDPSLSELSHSYLGSCARTVSH